MTQLAVQLTDTGHTWLIDRPIQIAVYVILGIVVRYLLHRAIDRATKPPAAGKTSRRRTRREKRAEEKRLAFDEETGGDTASGLRVDAGSGLTAAFLRKYSRQRSADDVRAERQRDERRAQRLQTIGSVLKSLVSFMVLLWIILQTLGILGVNVAPFIASAGIVGVALGFGAQALVRDFLSGLFMLFENQYGVGDWVDLGEASGTVETVGLRVTTVRDLHGTLWYCRNGEIMRVGNYSQDFGVAFLEFPVSYRADVDRACAIALDTATAAAAEEPMKSDLLSAPELQGVNQLGPDSWTMRMTVVTRANAQWATERELRRRIRKAFDDAGIDAPYPGGAPTWMSDATLAQ
ncbi:mechanosensitive ion channel family protein [Gordonia sp. (in: high G+C Gram-positive bacteria)]|uniref:mechanosensitive ion channel family protein n=1 Tax=Gordonia sp. (in: high G+C Gram-positive bacteria) TaxID=84139 RepID=UPI0016A4815B|nr:mechanosensitive ion channel family protein [Gordonia sp. (in: high G+C Gram-positive bacteria)]NLG47255.1 mechanosensitive ion channel family protein [Gordonia sp. (in: high G+C Gram-positive bacteria)]